MIFIESLFSAPNVPVAYMVARTDAYFTGSSGVLGTNVMCTLVKCLGPLDMDILVSLGLVFANNLVIRNAICKKLSSIKRLDYREIDAISGYREVAIYQERELSGQVFTMQGGDANQQSQQQVRSPQPQGFDPMDIDVRLQAIQGIAERPRINLKLDLFNPEKEKADADEFITRYEYFCLFNSLNNDTVRVNYFAVYLSHVAQLKVFRWMQEGIVTWADMMQNFLHEYRDRNALTNIMLEIGALTQNTKDSKYKSVKSVYDDYDQLLHKSVLYGGASQMPSEEAKIHRFICALKKEIQLHVIEHFPQPQTLWDALVIAQAKIKATKQV